MAKVTKRGNSLGVNINPLILQQTGIKENDEVYITFKGKKIIIEKVKIWFAIYATKHLNR